MQRESDAFELLLALDDGRPALERVSTDAAAKGERPEDVHPDDYPTRPGDWDNLEQQGWAVIVPAGAAGDRLLAIARPLIEKRAEDQGIEASEVKVLRVPSDKRYRTLTDAQEWAKEFYDDRSGSLGDVPFYQLILGDFEQVPAAIQQHQAINGLVGRLHFDDESGYEAYIAKLLRWEKAPRSAPGRVVVHTAHDGSPALRVGYNGLVTPLLDLMRELQEKTGRKVPFPGSSIVVGGGTAQKPDLDAFLSNTAMAEPGVLFTMSHGVGGPRGGWKSEADRVARQGAMHFMSNEALTGADLASRTFMPGGAWIMFACYGAGTPDVSAYKHWLERLVELGRIPSTGDVLSGIQGRPFVAALPQRVLANPNGPLAFIGHLDLAWTYSFQDGNAPSKKRPGQFYRVIDPMLRWNRVGSAFAQFAATQADTESKLIGLFDRDQSTGADVETSESIQRACLWMERQDLAGYILLGDPAARLPVAPPEMPKEKVKAKASEYGSAFAFAAPAASPAPESAKPKVEVKVPIDGDRLENAILSILIGDRKTQVVATELNLDRADLEGFVKSYQTAGREALGLKPKA